MTEQRVCDCGRPIFGTRSLSARHFEKCSVCRGSRRRRKATDFYASTHPAITLPPYVIAQDSAENWYVGDTRTGQPAGIGDEQNDRYASAEAAQSVATNLNTQAHLEPLRAEEASARVAIEASIATMEAFTRETETRYEQLRQDKANAIARLQDVQARLYAAENPDDGG